jgi:hypothetical protein
VDGRKGRVMNSLKGEALSIKPLKMNEPPESGDLSEETLELIRK